MLKFLIIAHVWKDLLSPYYRKNSVCTLCALEARKSMSPEEFYQAYGSQNKFSRISRFGNEETDDDDGSSTDHAGK